jgi:arginase
MALAVATGHCHRALWRGIPVPERNVVLAGSRDLDPPEEERLNRSEIVRVSAAGAGAAAARLPVQDVYLHVDIDVVNPLESPGVNFQGSGGIPAASLEEAIAAVASRKRIAAALIANYNPARDLDSRSLRLVTRLVELLRGLTL